MTTSHGPDDRASGADHRTRDDELKYRDGGRPAVSLLHRDPPLSPVGFFARRKLALALVAGTRTVVIPSTRPNRTP